MGGHIFLMEAMDFYLKIFLSRFAVFFFDNLFKKPRLVATEGRTAGGKAATEGCGWVGLHSSSTYWMRRDSLFTFSDFPFSGS